MRIGLVRHFEVIHSSQKLLTSIEYKDWVNEYDNADVKISPIDLGDINWEICYSSDLPRALQTAQSICNCKVIPTDNLREVPISPVFNTNLKLPVTLWLGLGRMAWILSHSSQPETREETTKRISSFLADIFSQKELNILLVTHGFLIEYIRKELLKSGFKGRRFIKARNGILYVLQK